MTDLPADFAARVRAARGYAGMSNRDDFGAALGVSGTTIKNYETGGHAPGKRAAGETVRLLAKASGLPEWFFTVPNLGAMRMAAGTSSVEQHLAAIERQLAEMAELLARQPNLTGEIHRAFEEYAARLGQQVGRRPPRSRGARDRPGESPGAVA